METVYLAIDVEKVDDGQGAAIVAFGACLGDAHGKVLQTASWYPAMPSYAKFGERCKAEFWDKHVGLYESFAARARPAAEVYAEFRCWLDALELQYPKIVILSDNPAYDLGAIDNRLEKYCDRLPVRYTSTGVYRWVSDWSERSDALGCYGKVREIAAKLMGDRLKRAHNPEIDAEYIYHCSVITERIRVAIKSDLDKLLSATYEKMDLSK